MKEMELKKKYKKGLYGELSAEEMDSILQLKAPSGKYYDYEKIRAVLLRKLKRRTKKVVRHRAYAKVRKVSALCVQEL